MTWSEAGPGQGALPYPFYIDIVTKQYFDAVDKKQLDRVLDCFHPDARLTEVTTGTVHDGIEAIAAMFRLLFASYDPIWHGNFVHVADPAYEQHLLAVHRAHHARGRDRAALRERQPLLSSRQPLPERLCVHERRQPAQGGGLMQYRPTLGRAALIDLAINRYFAQVDLKNLDAVLACFDDGAILTVQTSHTVHAGKAAIERMFVDLFGAWHRIVHKDFTITADDTNGRIAASFEAVLTAADGSVTRLHNTNFWRVRDGRFQEVHVYMSGANVLV